MTVKDEDHLADDHLHDNDDEANGKRRRVQRACDICRKKKTRCDGLQPEKGACSNCASYGLECTFADAVKRRAPPRSYVLALEARMEKAEEVIGQLAPYLDINKVLGPMPLLPAEKKEGEEDSQSAQYAMGHSQQDSFNEPFGPASRSTSTILSTGELSTSASQDDAGEDDEDEDAAFIGTGMKNVKLNVDSSPTQHDACKQALLSRNEVFHIDGDSMRLEPHPQPQPKAGGGNNESEVPMQFLGRASTFHLLPLLEKVSQDNSNTGSHQRSATSDLVKGIIKDSELSGEDDYSRINFDWPAPDLQQKLIDSYFARSNRDFPILNEVLTRKTLDKSDWKGKNGLVMAVALGVFCVGSQNVDDPRLVATEEAPIGITWYKALHNLLRSQFMDKGTALMSLQATLLSIVYSSAARSAKFVLAWVSLSAVVRMLEDCGAHRKFTAKRLGYSLLTEETYKRLWWVTYVLDRQLSADLGRPMAIQDEDFDLDEILLVDDEYICQASETNTEPVQPAGKLCAFSGFLQSTRLSQVIGKTLRTIYAISKSKISRGFVGPKWDALVVADIDKSLTRWLEAVPKELQYNPDEADTEALLQSSRIFLQYYYAQTLIHRPFIQSEKMDNPDLKFQSLAIVSNASRSAIHVTHNLLRRGLVGRTNVDVLFRTFAFGCMLLIISWSAYAKNIRVSPSIMEDVRKCLEIFEALNARWPAAEHMTRMLDVIIRRSRVPMASTSTSSGKRAYDQEAGGLSTAVPPSATSSDDTASRNIRQLPTASHPYSKTAFSLPLSTKELQSAFSTGSPDSNASEAASKASPRTRDLSSNSGGSYPPFNVASTANQDFAGNMQANGGAFSSQPNFASPFTMQQQVSQPYPAVNLQANSGSMDPTIFDPSTRAFDAFLGGGRITPGTMDAFTYPFVPQQGRIPGSNDAYLQRSEGLVGDQDPQQGLDGNMMRDPLDALVNIQSFWSDSDWMRALEFQA